MKWMVAGVFALFSLPVFSQGVSDFKVVCNPLSSSSYLSPRVIQVNNGLFSVYVKGSYSNKWESLNQYSGKVVYSRVRHQNNGGTLRIDVSSEDTSLSQYHYYQSFMLLLDAQTNAYKGGSLRSAIFENRNGVFSMDDGAVSHYNRGEGYSCRVESIALN